MSPGVEATEKRMRRRARRSTVAAMDRPRRVMSVLNVGTGLLLLGGIWGGLPVRWSPVDIPGTLLTLLFFASGVALWRGQPGSRKLGLVVAGISLVAGTVLGTTLMVTTGTLAGLYGPVGAGGAIILAAAFFLLVPYLVVFPASQIYFLLGHDTLGGPKDGADITDKDEQ